MNQSIQSFSIALFFSVCMTITTTAQNDYTINGKLGLDTVPDRTLDVNGDGHFKGELLLDDDLRMTKLASTDSLLQQLVYVDSTGRMQRLGEDGALTIALGMHQLSCIPENSDYLPTVFWNAEPGKIFAYSEICDFTPDVGIGTEFPEARLDVRGTSYFTESMGIGVLNESNTKLQVKTNQSNRAIEVLSTVLEDNEPVEKSMFYVTGEGTVKLVNVPYGANALSLMNAANPGTDVFSLFAHGGMRQVLEHSADQKAYWIRNGAEQVSFELNSNGKMLMQGMGSGDALTIRGEVDGTTGLTAKGNGFLQQRVSGNYSDPVISIIDADSPEENEVFFVQKNGEIKMLHLGDTHYAFSAAIDGLGYENVVIRANGRVDLSLDGDGSDKAFNINNMSLPGGGGQDVFHIRENGTMFMRYTGSDEFQDVLTIRSESYDGNIFRIDGKGRVLAASVHVRDLGNFTFPDYVFEPGYELMPLEKLRRFIADNHRLPNMPSAEEVKRNGVDLGEMNRLLVEKVEELTLYILEMEERLKAVEAK